MKTKHIQITALVAAIFSFGVLHQQADAAISITSFNLTTNSVTFTISGTLPNDLPPSETNALFFVNPILPASQGFALGDFVNSDSSSFTGLQALRALSPVSTGAHSFGDYFFVAFANPLTAGEAVSGVLTATWSGTAFDPTEVSDLNVYWGSNFTITDGTFLTTVPVVPEPSSALLAAVGSLALLRRSRKK